MGLFFKTFLHPKGEGIIVPILQRFGKLKFTYLTASGTEVDVYFGTGADNKGYPWVFQHPCLLLHPPTQSGTPYSG